MNRAFCGKSMKLGTYVHHTKPSKFSYSAKPDFPRGAFGGHLKNGCYATIAQKLRGVHDNHRPDRTYAGAKTWAKEAHEDIVLDAAEMRILKVNLR